MLWDLVRWRTEEPHAENRAVVSVFLRYEGSGRKQAVPKPTQLKRRQVLAPTSVGGVLNGRNTASSRSRCGEEEKRF